MSAVRTLSYECGFHRASTRGGWRGWRVLEHLYPVGYPGRKVGSEGEGEENYNRPPSKFADHQTLRLIKKATA